MKSSFRNFFYRLPFVKQWRLWIWKRSLDLIQHERLFNELYSDVDGFSLSKIARADCDAPEYLYGEIEFLSFVALLGRCSPNQSTIFYDLGSGTGKAVLTMALVFHVKQSIGIELFPALHQAAVAQKNKLALVSKFQSRAKTIQFIQDNFLNQSISDANLIFINATAFFGQHWIDISTKLEQISSGSFVITTSKPLRSSAFQLQEQTWALMSWGVVKTYIQYRK